MHMKGHTGSRNEKKYTGGGLAMEKRGERKSRGRDGVRRRGKS